MVLIVGLWGLLALFSRVKGLFIYIGYKKKKGEEIG